MPSLENIGYYRLSGLLAARSRIRPDRRNLSNRESALNRIIRVYEFDRELRNLAQWMRSTGCEIAVRSRIVNATCQAWGSHWFMDAARLPPPAINHDPASRKPWNASVGAIDLRRR